MGPTRQRRQNTPWGQISDSCPLLQMRRETTSSNRLDTVGRVLVKASRKKQGKESEETIPVLFKLQSPEIYPRIARQWYCDGMVCAAFYAPMVLYRKRVRVRVRVRLRVCVCDKVACESVVPTAAASHKPHTAHKSHKA